MPTEEMTGTLGGSVTFHLNTSKQPDSISWLRAKGENPALIAVVDIGPPCRIMVQRFEFEGRLNISGNCKNLRISNLDQSDSGTYKGQMKDDEESFRLKVYKNLLKSDLKVQCENYTHSDANYTLQLNCSAGIWEDGVNYTWTSQHKNGNIFSHIVQIPDDDANYTCTAENPVSKASLTVSVKQACEENQPSDTPPSGKLLWVIAVVPVIVAAVVIAGIFLWKKKKRAEHSMGPDTPACTACCDVCRLN